MYEPCGGPVLVNLLVSRFIREPKLETFQFACARRKGHRGLCSHLPKRATVVDGEIVETYINSSGGV